ncbi:MAG TPA: hypothetical protein VKX25_00185 [Bryobacteraceae bacterium]|nr:hypothetical protein [Bryobacteraceae bacterium]
MQRLIAILILWQFSFAPAIAALAAPQTTLPACCRKDGKHHCAQYSRRQSAPALTTICSQCPLGAMAAPAHSQYLYRNSAGLRFPSSFAGFVNVSVIRSTSYHRTLSKPQRGPPSLLG